MAKEAANITRLCLKPISASDMKSHVKKQILSFWKENWQALNHNKLKNIGTEIGKKNFQNFQNRIDQIKFTRIRLGHTRLTHSYYFTGEGPPICTQCNVVVTIVHILLVCPKYYNHRKTYFGNSIISLKQLLNPNNTEHNYSILNFFKSINLFSEL